MSCEYCHEDRDYQEAFFTAVETLTELLNKEVNADG